MWYAAAGVVFGFVLGYMAANAGGGQPPASPKTFETRPVATAPGAGTAALASPPAVHALDPNEVKALESLAAREPQNAKARIELGNLLMDHERWDDAIRWYGEALKLDPRNADVRTDMGACFVHSGRASEALAVFDEALKAEPGHKKALFNKGIALMQSGRVKEAVALWEDLLKRYPDDPQLQPLRQQIEGVRSGAGR